jgi:UDP-N-acetylglucosamine--N-acetylmuramyl-(pentapeptide) pyrophosphoryl-undecaprenol N-acetylglucosamine transferase
MKKNKTIFFSGGGTIGPITPLLAVMEKMMKLYPDYNYYFIGTNFGPEKKLLNSEKWPQTCHYLSLSAGKWRRYFSIKNFLDIFKILVSFFQAFYYLIKYRPSLVLSAGAYVSVPLAYAAFILQIPVIIHQQDIVPGLANRLMSKVASQVSVSLEQSLSYFKDKGILIGNPYRQDIIDQIKLRKQEYFKKWNFNDKLPVLLVIGGSSGSIFINQLLVKAWPVLKNFWQVVHVGGYFNHQQVIAHQNYRYFKFLANLDLLSLMSCSNLVISRAGLGTITELFALEKPAIIIPMPNSHQEQNAKYLKEKQAAIVKEQSSFSDSDLIQTLFEFKEKKELAVNLKFNISKIMPDLAVDNFIKLIQKYV